MKIKMMVFLFVLMVAAPVYGLERFEIITTQQLKQMLAEREAGNIDFLLVNSLDRLIYEHSAIPGSLNLPWSEASSGEKILGPDKDRMIVTY